MTYELTRIEKQCKHEKDPAVSTKFVKQGILYICEVTTYATCVLERLSSHRLYR